MTEQALVRRIAHTRGANFSLGFRLLPASKRVAVYAAYAACRIPDDIVDEVGVDEEPGAVERRLDAWKAELEATYAGRPGTDATRALADVLGRFAIPKTALLGLVEGCRMDLRQHRYQTFADLEGYCELVAVTISDISLSIFGVLGPEAARYGRSLAMALQLTNICRDVGEDAARGRIYLPLDELAAHGVGEDEVLAGRVDTLSYRALMAFQCARARSCFAAANPLPPRVERDARTTVRVMGGVYRRVLDRVTADPVRAYSVRADLPRWQRLWAILAGTLGFPFV
ncbi:MAG TPA: squalene/phytoene synthase family protein [Thermoanaerobaculaceae bacterium]|nr:squalene/phytoene synthase family protein [Thermoanaerobaculaceae bacterium]HPS80175.1 squalene/phytoene synthase family protein [Thermoanaerobaculaceae bacterium]